MNPLKQQIVEGSEVFEVHITGDESIIAACEKLGCRTITIDLLKPDKSVLRTEYMTSLIVHMAPGSVAAMRGYEGCRSFVSKICGELEKLDVKIFRVKIESPYYKHYEDQSLYMESHYVTEDNKHPISRSRHKTTCLATERTYDKLDYQAFRQRHKGREVELCLMDTFVTEDKDWFDLYAAERKLCHCVGYTVAPDCPACDGTGFITDD